MDDLDNNNEKLRLIFNKEKFEKELNLKNWSIDDYEFTQLS